MKSHGTKIFILFVFFFQLFSCGSKTALIEDPGSSTISFRDPLGLIEAAIPAGMDYMLTTTELLQTHEFIRKDGDGDILEKIRFNVEKVPALEKADVFSAAYENRFIAGCKCNVLERGVVNIGGKPGKQYRTAVKNTNLVGYQWHVSHRDYYIVVGTRGPVENSRRVKELFDQILKGLHFIPAPQ